MKKKVLVVCPLPRDVRELSLNHISNSYEVVFHEYNNVHVQNFSSNDTRLDACLSQAINQMVQHAQEEAVEGVFSSGDYPGSIFSNIVANALGLPGAHPAHILRFQHKYCARLIQKKYVSNATPNFCLLPINDFDIQAFKMPLPVFVKPVKSSFSIFADRACTLGDVERLVSHYKVFRKSLSPFEWFARRYGLSDLCTDYLLAEELLEGKQVTLEGYVYNGSMYVLGIVDSIMFSNMISFKRFEYPSSLSQSIQKRMGDCAEQVMSGLGFDNSFFNIEYMYNSKTDAIYIIEINPRLASQFADLYEKVDGTNSYIYALDVAVGKKPEPTICAGNFNCAASFVLRLFEDKKIKCMPAQKEIDSVYALFPEARVQLYGKVGNHLSDETQDGKSYRYGLIHLGGRDKQELFEKYETCKKMLHFEFADVD